MRRSTCFLLVCLLVELSLVACSHGTSTEVPPPPPSFSISFTTPLTGTLTGLQAVAWSAQGGSGGNVYTLSLDGKVLYQGLEKTYSWNTSGASNGSHVLAIRVADAKGKTAEADKTVLVDNSQASLHDTSIVSMLLDASKDVLLCGKATWKPVLLAQNLGLSVAPVKDGVQYCAFAGADSGRFGIAYGSIASFVSTIRTDSLVTTMSLLFQNAGRVASDTIYSFLQEYQQGSMTLASIATWDSFTKDPTKTIGSSHSLIGTTASGSFSASPTLIFWYHQCNEPGTAVVDVARFDIRFFHTGVAAPDPTAPEHKITIECS